MKPLLVGEMPSVAEGPESWTRPLSGRVATTLCGLAELSPVSYGSLCESFDCENLVRRARNLPSGWWSSLEARTVFEQIWARTFNPCVVLLGRNVAKAAGLADLEWGEWHCRLGVYGSYRPVTVIPHPSGLNRLYNDPEYRDLASRTLSEALDTCRVD